MNVMRGLFPILNGMHGIAAILIVVRHTAPIFGQNPFSESYLAVDLFFVLSGVVIANAYESKLLEGMEVAQFAKIRLIRLYPLYALSLFLVRKRFANPLWGWA